MSNHSKNTLVKPSTISQHTNHLERVIATIKTPQHKIACNKMVNNSKVVLGAIGYTPEHLRGWGKSMRELINLTYKPF